MKGTWEEVVRQAQFGNEESITYLWDKLTPLRYKWAYSCHFQGWDLEDYIQQSYLILLDTLKRYDGTKGMSFEGFYKMRLYVWRQAKCRKRDYELWVDLAQEMHYTQISLVTGDVCAEYMQLESSDRLNRVMGLLSDEQREIVLAFYHRRQTQLQISHRLGLTPRQVKYKKEVALKVLKSHLIFC